MSLQAIKRLRGGVFMKGMGDTTAYLRWGIREIICLALFYFTFLAGEYLFDMRVAEFVPPSEVATYETLIVGASVIGFFVRPILYYRRPPRDRYDERHHGRAAGVGIAADDYGGSV